MNDQIIIFRGPVQCPGKLALCSLSICRFQINFDGSYRETTKEECDKFREQSLKNYFKK